MIYIIIIGAFNLSGNLFLPLHLSDTLKVHNHYSLINNDGDCLPKYETSNTQPTEGAER